MSNNGAVTLYESLAETARLFPTNEFLAEIKNGNYQASTYSDILQQVQALAFGLQQLGLGKGDKVAFMIPNGKAWVVTDLACAQLGIIDIPIHTTYSFQYLSYTLQHSGAKTLIIQDTLYQKFSPQLQELGMEKIIMVGQVIDEKISWQQLQAEGKITEYLGGDKDSIHTIIYTSGTTAEPKGVMLTHQNIIANARGAAHHVPIDSHDRFFSFLPLSHALERTGALYAALQFGSSLYFARGNDSIAEDIQLARPTIMLAVPRVFERIYAKIMTRVDSSSAAKKKMFYECLSLRRDLLNHQHLSGPSQLKLKILDYLILRKIRQSLGNRLKLVISGGAALDQKIAKFFQTVGIVILEGYGLTETSPVITVNKVNNYRFGSVGLPIPGMEVRISSDKEILTRGVSVMSGYYNDEAATAATIDTEGWLHTGDLGSIDKEGFLTIVGRSKDMIVLSNGKNVNPIALENALDESRFISQSMVYSNSDKYISALIVPNFSELQVWLQEKQISGRVEDMINTPSVKDLFKDIIKECLEDFNTFEQIQDFKILTEEFTQENGLLTPTLKLKRKKIENLYM